MTTNSACSSRAGLFSGKLNRRGAIMDVMFLIAFAFAFAIMCYIGLQIVKDWREGSNPVLSQTGQDINNDFYANRSVFDSMVVLFMFGLSMVIVVSAAFIRTFPAFFWISLFIWVISIIVAAPFANSFEDFRNDSANTVSADFPMTNFLFDHFVLYIVITCMLVAIALYIFFERGHSDETPCFFVD